MKAIRIKNGIAHIAESFANCPYCKRLVTTYEAFDKLMVSEKFYIKHKCIGCKRFIGITADHKGDLRAFELPYSNHK